MVTETVTAAALGASQRQLSRDRYRVIVDLALGGRVLEWSLRGRNALHLSGPEIGSTFWLSPQSAWDWPPPPTIDKKSYTLSPLPQPADANTELCMVSDVCQLTQMRVTKHLRLHDRYLDLEYRLQNHANTPQHYAHWEISRVAGGLTFYASRSAPLSMSSAQSVQSAECVWLDYQPMQQAGGHQKLFGNGSEGWLANAVNGLMFVKQFDTVAAECTAPGEAEVEIYAHGDLSCPYVEVEQQGPYWLFEPEQTRTWRVRWFLESIPEDLSVTVGNPDLVSWVRRLIESSE